MSDEPQRIKITAVEISDQYASDILTTAVEGGMTASWLNEETSGLKRDDMPVIERAGIADPDQLDELSVRHIHFKVDVDGKGLKHYKVGLPEIKAAVGRMVKRNSPIDPRSTRYCHPRIVNDILGDNMDAESADCVLQVAAFDEVIFG